MLETSRSQPRANRDNTELSCRQKVFLDHIKSRLLVIVFPPLFQFEEQSKVFVFFFRFTLGRQLVVICCHLYVCNSGLSSWKEGTEFLEPWTKKNAQLSKGFIKKSQWNGFPVISMKGFPLKMCIQVLYACSSVQSFNLQTLVFATPLLLAFDWC